MTDNARRRTTTRASVLATVLATALLLGLVLAPPPLDAQQTQVSDTLLVVKDEEAPSNAELAVRLSEATPLPDTSTVVVGRSDVFADSLASGVLQSRSPLLLVPPQGPVPDRVAAELRRLGARRVILLGGESALGQVVEQELATSYAVERRAGQTRFETATAIAEQDAPEATTAILARAFPSSGADDTQAFADALAAGGMAAQLTAPVLLTNADSLPAATRAHLERSAIQRVLIIGGTAAISQGVADELTAMGRTVERIAGSTRFDTAVAVAEKLEADSAADVERVTLVEGQGPDAWAGGFAAAAHSAHYDAPIVLSAGDSLPPATLTFLEGNTAPAPSFAVPTTDLTDPVLTCVVPVAACERARVGLGLPPSATVEFSPRSATRLTPGQEVAVTVTGGGGGFAQAEEITIEGSCLDEATTVPVADGTTTVTTSTAPPEPCTIDVSVPLSNGSVQTTTATYPGGTIEGTVRSATTGEPIPGATITLASGTVTSTDPTGSFGIDDLPGGRTTATVEAEGFVTGTFTADVLPATSTPVDWLLSPQLGEGQVRIVLSWGQTPSDLDSHLWLPATQPFHLFFAQRGQLEACPFAMLDIDDVTGFGPETITIGQALPGTYRYAVHNFSGSPSLSSSGAVVQVFDPSGLVAEFSVPLNGTLEQRVWHVFDLDVGAGALTPVNRMLPEVPDAAPYAESASC